MDKEFEELFKKGKKSRQEVDSMIQLANEVQYAIIKRKLQPGMRLAPRESALSRTFFGPRSCSDAYLLQPNCLPTPRRCSCPYLSRY
jgi:hypothetical protein